MGNCIILPVAWDEKDGWNSQYISLREAMLKEMLSKVTDDYQAFAMTNDMPYCNLYHYHKAGIIHSFNSLAHFIEICITNIPIN